MIKYIKNIIWRLAKRLSYTEDARCLKVNKASHNALLYFPEAAVCLCAQQWREGKEDDVQACKHRRLHALMRSLLNCMNNVRHVVSLSKIPRLYTTIITIIIIIIIIIIIMSLS